VLYHTKEVFAVSFYLYSCRRILRSFFNKSVERM